MGCRILCRLGNRLVQLMYCSSRQLTEQRCSCAWLLETRGWPVLMGSAHAQAPAQRAPRGQQPHQCRRLRAQLQGEHSAPAQHILALKMPHKPACHACDLLECLSRGSCTQVPNAEAGYDLDVQAGRPDLRSFIQELAEVDAPCAEVHVAGAQPQRDPLCQHLGPAPTCESLAPWPAGSVRCPAAAGRAAAA